VALKSAARLWSVFAQNALALVLLLFCAGFWYISLLVAATRPLTPLESDLLQGGTVVSGFCGSFLLGRNSAAGLGKAKARSALARVKTIRYAQVSLLASVEERREVLHGGVTAGPGVPIPLVDASLDLILKQAEAHIATAEDAIDDWADILPGEVSGLRSQLNSPSWGGVPNSTSRHPTPASATPASATPAPATPAPATPSLFAGMRALISGVQSQSSKVRAMWATKTFASAYVELSETERHEVARAIQLISVDPAAGSRRRLTGSGTGDQSDETLLEVRSGPLRVVFTVENQVVYLMYIARRERPKGAVSH